MLASLRLEFLSELTAMDQKTVDELKQANKKYFKAAFKEKSFAAWVAKEGGKIIATSGLCFYKIPPNNSCPNGKAAYIQNMYTKPEYRKKGIAKALFSKIIDEAKTWGCSKVLLNATDAGKPLYEKFGFKESNDDMYLNI